MSIANEHVADEAERNCAGHLLPRKRPMGGGEVYLCTSCSHPSVCDEVIDNTKVTSFAAVVAFSYASILLRFNATGVGC